MKFPEKKIGVTLLDQSVIADIGNILRNEILFRARVQRKGIKELLYVYNKYRGFCKNCGGLIKFYMQSR